MEAIPDRALVKDLAHLSAARGELVAGCLDIRDDQVEALGRTGRRGRHVGAELNRAL